MAINPKLQEFVRALDNLLGFIAPEHRPAVVPCEDYHPHNDPDFPVFAILIGGRFAAFPVLKEYGRRVEEVVRVEELNPTPDRQFHFSTDLGGIDDPSLVTDCGSAFNAKIVVQCLFQDFYMARYR